MSFVLPLVNRPQFSFEVSLESRAYRFDFRWNSHGDFYSFDILTRGGEPIIEGIRLVIGYELIRKYGKPELPPGALVAVDTTGRLRRPRLNSLTSDLELIYMTEDEVINVLSQAN